MPKKIPNCAHCGVSLKEKKLGSGATVMLDYQDAIGKPMIGWHESCWDDDDITDCAQGCIGGQNMGPPPDDWTPHAVKVIALRDKSRVSGGVRFWRHAWENCLHWLHDIAADGEVVNTTVRDLENEIELWRYRACAWKTKDGVFVSGHDVVMHRYEDGSHLNFFACDLTKSQQQSAYFVKRQRHHRRIPTND